MSTQSRNKKMRKKSEAIDSPKEKKRSRTKEKTPFRTEQKEKTPFRDDEEDSSEEHEKRTKEKKKDSNIRKSKMKERDCDQDDDHDKDKDEGESSEDSSARTAKSKPKSKPKSNKRKKPDKAKKSKDRKKPGKSKMSKSKKMDSKTKSRTKATTATDKKKEKNGLRLDKNDKIISGTRISVATMQVSVVKILGSGGFGDVYLVKDMFGTEYAMKTEYKMEGLASRIKHEVKAYDHIMKIRSKTPEAVMHLLGFFGSGAIGEMKFFVMSLVGASVDDLITQYDIKWPTALRLFTQMFDGIVELHKAGFVHRDIKPANYSVGIEDQKRRIYLVDFGMVCRVITDEAKMPKTSVYDFIGTLLYAPRISHLGGVQTRKDDLESWLYTCYDIMAPSKVPWAPEGDREKVFEMKQNFFKTPEKFFDGPCQFLTIIDKIDRLDVLAQPDYAGIRKLLEEAGRDEGCDVDNDGPFDWETKDNKIDNPKKSRIDLKERKAKDKMRIKTPEDGELMADSTQ